MVSGDRRDSATKNKETRNKILARDNLYKFNPYFWLILVIIVHQK